jgi:PhnB protein
VLINAYLSFNGNCKEAFTFYEQLLGGKIVMMMSHKGSPMEAQTPPEWLDKIMHARLIVGESALMASDAPPGHGGAAKGFSINIGVDDPSEAERIFHGLAEGGSVTMPIAETFWALRFGMLTDRFGIPWMVNCEKPMPAKE